jgi:hypothetical protein
MPATLGNSAARRANLFDFRVRSHH